MKENYKSCTNCCSKGIDPCEHCQGYSEWTGKENNTESIRSVAVNLVNDERNRQDAKWGIQNHAQSQWVGILGEEFGEYCQAVNETYLNNATKKHEGGYDNLLKELTHVAAVAVGAMESLMRNKEDK